MGKMKTESVKLSQIEVNQGNPRIISDDKFSKLINSILVLPKMLELRPIVVDKTMVALGGNMRYRALMAIADMSFEDLKERLSSIRDYQKKTQVEQDSLVSYWEQWQGNPTAPIIKASELTDAEQREFIIRDNVGYGEWDIDMLASGWDAEELSDWGVDDWQDSGWQDDSASEAKEPEPEVPTLAERFVVPPFSVLDSRQGYWQKRKFGYWRPLIGDMGESREDKLGYGVEMKYAGLYQKTSQHRKELGISFREYLDKYVSEEVKAKEAAKTAAAGVSLFDPVLSEIVCKWFTPKIGSKIFDCFAGDTQKGLVFGMCGYEFTGIELRPEQVDINNRILEGRELPIRYICDDGQNVAQHIAAGSQDMLFSCPPYFDLERYSDLPNDASNQDTYEDFLKILSSAFKAAVGCLKNNRFAVIVVGDVRNKKNGCYYDFCGDVKRIFKEAGMLLYNELILVEQIASNALRAGNNMDSRKVSKTHQNVLVFFKGDTAQIRNEFPPIVLDEEEQKLMSDIMESYAHSDEAYTGTDEQSNELMLELQKFRKPYQEDGVIAYELYPHMRGCLESGDIHIHRNAEGAIEGYLWMQDLKRKPLSRIYEIVSNRKGLGREMIEEALRIKKHDTLQLYVLDTNENAISFYKHMGFVEVDREKGNANGKNNITMEYKGNAGS